MSLMVLQAGALEITAPDDATRRAADALRTTGCQALDELRDLIGVLREAGSDPPSPGDAPGSPGLVTPASERLPGAALHELVQASASVGLRVDLTERGDPAAVAPVVGRTAQLVVQEALTNVRKHARGRRRGFVLRALHVGASGFLLKSTAPQELISLVRAAAGGHTVMSRSVTRSLLSSAVDREQSRQRRLACLDDLTERETDVLACLASGMSNGEIAAALSLSEPTVKGHISRILVKTHSTNRTQAGLLGFEAGLGTPR